MFIILEFRRLGQEDQKFEASLSSTLGHGLKIKLKGKPRVKRRKEENGEDWEGKRNGREGVSDGEGRERKRNTLLHAK